MPSFVWKGRTRTGQFQEGILLADTRSAAVATLRRQQIRVSSLREKGREIPLIPKLPLRISTKRLAVFTRQFSVMLDAGLPLVGCLEILGEQEEHRKFRDIVQQVRADVEAGSSLSDAMAKHPAAFDQLYVSMVSAGEAGGILDIILQRLSIYLEKLYRLKNQIRSAMIYPAVVVTIACVVVYVILWKVIPVFTQLFSALGGEMPFLTRMVVGASNIIGRYGLGVIAILVAGLFAVRAYHRTYRGRRVIDGLLLKLPVIGILLRKIAVARFSRTLSTLTASGVPILEGLDITAKTSGNAIIEDAVLAVRRSVEEGKTLSAPLRETKVFPPMVVQMIYVGEQTGALDQMLTKIADFYEDEVDIAVAGLIKLLEPIMIVFLGVIIGTIVTAMYLPLYTVLSRIS
jgi:type IV pilus assembly protein PilC